MATNYHHGVTVTETTDLSTMITDIDSAVIGVVCTACKNSGNFFYLLL